VQGASFKNTTHITLHIPRGGSLVGQELELVPVLFFLQFITKKGALFYVEEHDRNTMAKYWHNANLSL